MVKTKETPVAKFTALEKTMAVAIVAAFTVAQKAEDVAQKKGAGAFGMCVTAFTKGATFEGIEAAQPKLVAAKVSDGKGGKVKTRLRSAWDSAKSVIRQCNTASPKIPLTDEDGKVRGKSDLQSELAKRKASPGPQVPEGEKPEDAGDKISETGAVETIAAPEMTLNEMTAKVFEALQLEGGKGTLGYELRTAYAEAILTVADVVSAEQSERFAAIASAVKAQSARAETRAQKKARLAAEAKANSETLNAEVLAAGMTVRPEGERAAA